MKRNKIELALMLGCVLCIGSVLGGQPTVFQYPDKPAPKKSASGAAKPMTIPVGVNARGATPETELQTVDLVVGEDGEPQSTLSIRTRGDSPMTLAILIQDDLVSSTGTRSSRWASSSATCQKAPAP